jgi:hypothetical protein
MFRNRGAETCRCFAVGIWFVYYCVLLSAYVGWYTACNNMHDTLTQNTNDICTYDPCAQVVVSYNLESEETGKELGYTRIKVKANRHKTAIRYKVSQYPNEPHIGPKLLRQLGSILSPGTGHTTFLLRVFSPLEKFHTNWWCSNDHSQ